MRKLPQNLYTAFCIGMCSLALSGCLKQFGIESAPPVDTTAKPVNTRLPEGFPVPIYPGADVKQVDEVPMKNANKKSYTVRLESSDDIAKITGYYAYTLGKAGWAVREMRMESFGLSNDKTLVAISEDNQITISVTRNGDKTGMSIFLTPISAYSPATQK
jgi:hypothetical protein